jgi:hypothetical protein
MDLAEAELLRGLAGEAPEWRERALGEAKKMREDALARCREGRVDRQSHACAMRAKTYEDLLHCPGWQ